MRFALGIATPRGAALALALVSVLAAGRAGADAPSGDAPAPLPLPLPLNDEKESRHLFQRAELSFSLGKFPEALADYQSAYQAKPLPGFLFNIAQCYRNMGNFERARFFFRRYLVLEPRAPNRRRVDDLIAEMTHQLEMQPASTTTAPPPEPAPPLPMAPAPAVVTTSLVTPPPAAPSRPLWKRWWFWTGVGAVVVGGVVATVLLTRPDVRAPGSLQPIDGR